MDSYTPGPLKNTQWEKFAVGLFEGKTKTEAALDAGYGKKSARSKGSQLSNNVNIRNRIAELQEAVACAAIMDVRERMERLTEIGRARLTDFVCAGPDGDQVNIGPESENNGALLEITSITKYNITEGGGEVEGESAVGISPSVITKVKLHNPIQAIKELNEMDGVYPPKSTKHVGPDGGPIQHKMVEELTDEELTGIAADKFVRDHASRGGNGATAPKNGSQKTG